jgi:enoyl-CoA hydratase
MRPDPVLSSRNGRVLTLSLNRPDRLNAVSSELYTQLIAGLDRAEADPEIRAVVITGEGRAFCVGADQKAHSAGSRTSEDQREYVDLGQQACLRIQTVSVPVVAAVNGFALGAGAEMATSADFLLMAEDAEMGFPEASIGTFVGGGITHRLPRLIGLRRATELLFLGHRFTGTDAAAWGLAYACTSGSELPARAQDLAAELAAKAPISLARMKNALRSDPSLDQALKHEADDLLNAMDTQDWAEGLAAFSERRTPNFEGR